MTDPTYGQPEIPPAVDPWATGELRSDPTTSTPTPPTVPQVPPQVPPQPAAPQVPRGVAPVTPATPVTTGAWEPPPYRGGSRKAVVLVAVAALAVVVGGFAFALTGARNWFAPQTSATTAGPPATGTTANQSTAPLSGPFDGTPAQAYPKGSAGIELPTAIELPGFTAAQVTAGLQKVKAALIAARLDPKMLTGHDTSVLLGLLAPDARGPIEDAFTNHKFLGFATQLGPDQKLSADPVRVKGGVTFSATTSEDASKFHLIQVQTNFVWVYGFDGPSTKPGQRMVTIHDQVTWLVTADSEVGPSSRGLYLRSWRSYSYNMDCTLVKQDLIGLGQPSTVSTAPSIDVNKLLDPTSSLDVGADTC